MWPLPWIPQVFRFREDYPLGRLSSGTHTLRVVVDGGEAVAESDESDNQYTKTFFVSGACFPLTTRVSPRGAGTVTPSREPNCGSATLGVRSPGVDDQESNQELGMGGEPVLQAQRDKAFEAMRARIQAEGKARVIVGLRTDGRSVSAAVSSLNEAEARSPLISQVQQSLLTRLGSYNLSSVRRFKYMPHVAMVVDGAALEALASDPEVVTLEEDIRVEPSLETSTALVGAPNAWSQGYSGAGQAVAILDTGVDGEHSFLKDRVVSEACYSGSGSFESSVCPGGVKESTGIQSGEPCSLGSCFHGTAVAGVASGGGTNFSGVAPESGIIAIQVFSRCPGPVNCLTSSTSDWVAGLERVLELSGGFDIAAVNMSFSGRLFSEDCDADFPAVKAAMDNLRAFGIAPVAASGNKRSSTGIDFPSCISSAVSVGSTDTGADETTADEVSSFSNSSPLLDLLAPGGRINTSVPGEGFGRYSGTSFSAPHVTGAWAVLKSKAPNASVPDLLSALKSTGAPILDPRNQLIKPRIQVDAALDKIVKELPYSTGTRMTLTAQPNPGFRFKSWQGCDSPSGNRCVVEMDSVEHVVALFEPTAAAHPDLIPTSLLAPPTAETGRPISIYAAVGNPGPVDAGPFRIGFYLSVDDIITTEDTWFAACSFDSGLPAGESESCNRLFPLPPRVSAGRYVLGAIVDDLDQVAESSETNNAKASDAGPLEVFAPPIGSRLFIPVVLSAAGLRNSFFTSELTLTNRGTQEARTRIHLPGAQGRGKRPGVRCDRPRPAADPARCHRLSPPAGAAHSPDRKPHRDAGGKASGFFFGDWSPGPDRHRRARGSGRASLPWHRRRPGIPGSGLSVRLAPEQTGPLQCGLPEYGDDGRGTDHLEDDRLFGKSRRGNHQGPGDYGAWPRRVSPVFASVGDRGQRLRQGGAGRREGPLLRLRRHQRPGQLRRLLRLSGHRRLAGGQSAPHPAGDRRDQ